uniref:Putative tumor-related protein n=1 Tax=Papaver somniferum TaxID=3469 RepID=A0A481S8P2_PAPSO|nr:putative tumor-related protein [Papaver somniferum]
MYRKMFRAQKKILWHNMMPVMYPFTQENILEPEKSEPKGRKSKKMNNFQTRQANRELLATHRDPSGVDYHDARYEKAKKEIEKVMNDEVVKVPRKRGRPSIQKSETSNKEVDENDFRHNKRILKRMYPSQTNVNEKRNVHEIGRMRGPRRGKSGNYLRPINFIYDNYLEDLSSIIHEHIVKMDDVKGYGNCGYYVTAEQLGPFKEGNNPVPHENEVNYIRQRLLQMLCWKKEFYKTMMRGGPIGDAGVAAEYFAWERRLHGDLIITQEHWMSMPICGFLIAEAFDCVVHCFGWTGSSFTYAPPTRPFHDGVKDRRCYGIFSKLSFYRPQA